MPVTISSITARQRVDLEREIHLEGAGIDPSVNRVAKHSRRGQLPKNIEGQRERRAHRRARQCAGGLVAQRSAKEQIDHAA